MDWRVIRRHRKQNFHIGTWFRDGHATIFLLNRNISSMMWHLTICLLGKGGRAGPRSARSRLDHAFLQDVTAIRPRLERVYDRKGRLSALVEIPTRHDSELQ